MLPSGSCRKSALLVAAGKLHDYYIPSKSSSSGQTKINNKVRHPEYMIRTAFVAIQDIRFPVQDETFSMRKKDPYNSTCQHSSVTGSIRDRSSVYPHRKCLRPMASFFFPFFSSLFKAYYKIKIISLIVFRFNFNFAVNLLLGSGVNHKKEPR